MEGLLPKIYKSLKRSKRLRQRKNPQPSPIQNIQDFYPDGYNFIYDIPPPPLQQQLQLYPKIEAFDTKTKLMQKTKLMHHHAGGRSWHQESIKSPKKLGNQRRMFSCITGAA